MDILGAEVTGGNLRHTVFCNKKNNKRAVVVYNADMQKSAVATVTLEGSTDSLVMVSPEKQTPTKFEGNVEIEPQSLVVIMEK